MKRVVSLGLLTLLCALGGCLVTTKKPADLDDAGGEDAATTGGGSDANGPRADGSIDAEAGGPDTGAPDAQCDAPTTFYRDQDEDGRGDPDDSVQACSAPEGYVDNDDDHEPTCTTNDGEDCELETLRCHPDGSEKRQQCAVDEQGCRNWLPADSCPASAPRCDTTDDTCKGCTDNDHCEGFQDLGVCAEDGTCVQCTADDASGCKGNACNALTQVCSAFAPNSADVCEPCDADENCADGRFCVDMLYQGEPHGSYCLDEFETSCQQPFAVVQKGRSSRSTVSKRSWCGVDETLTTCEAVLGLDDNATCASSSCPVGAICRQVGPLTDRCTYPCASPDQCLDPGENPARSTCGNELNDDEGPDYCGGETPD